MPVYTKESPLILPLDALMYLFSIAENTDRLINTMLNQKPVAELAREIINDLHQLEIKMRGKCSEAYGALLEEAFFTNVKLCDQRLALWEIESDEETT